MSASQAREERRQHIFREGLEMFLEVGFEAATMRELAKRVGIGLGTIYEYYPSKDSILLEYFQQLLDGIWSSTEALLDSLLPTDVKLATLVKSHVAQLARNLKVTRMLLFDSQHLRPESQRFLADARDRYRQLVATLVREGQSKGLFRPDVPADWAAAAVLGAVAMVVGSWLTTSVGDVLGPGVEFLGVDEAAEQAVNLVLYGLANPGRR